MNDSITGRDVRRVHDRHLVHEDGSICVSGQEYD